MYCGHIHQLNSEPGRGRRGQIGFASAAVELCAAVEPGAAVELFSSHSRVHPFTVRRR